MLSAERSEPCGQPMLIVRLLAIVEDRVSERTRRAGIQEPVMSSMYATRRAISILRRILRRACIGEGL